MAKTKLLNIDIGSNFSFSITPIDLNNNPLNITSGSGCTATGQLKKSYFSTNETPILFQSIFSDTSNLMTFSLSPDVTSTMKIGRYVWDINLQLTGGQIIRQKQGYAFLNPDV